MQLSDIQGDQQTLCRERTQTCDDFITSSDIRRIEVREVSPFGPNSCLIQVIGLKCGIEFEEIQLHQNDGQSVLNWVERLHKEGSILGFKSSMDLPLWGLGLAKDTFALIIQNDYQREAFAKYRHHSFAGLDATHNMTHYENMSLFTVMVHDHWGHGKLI